MRRAQAALWVYWKGIPGLPGSLQSHKVFPLGPSYDPKPARTRAGDATVRKPEVGRAASSQTDQREGRAQGW